MFCKKCGMELDDDSLFCKSCGAPVNSAVNTQIPVQPAVSTAAQENKKKKKTITAVVCAVLALVIAVSGIFGWIIGRKNSDDKDSDSEGEGTSAADSFIEKDSKNNPILTKVIEDFRGEQTVYDLEWSEDSVVLINESDRMTFDFDDNGNITKGKWNSSEAYFYYDKDKLIRGELKDDSENAEVLYEYENDNLNSIKGRRDGETETLLYYQYDSKNRVSSIKSDLLDDFNLSIDWNGDSAVAHTGDDDKAMNFRMKDGRIVSLSDSSGKEKYSAEYNSKGCKIEEVLDSDNFIKYTWEDSGTLAQNIVSSTLTDYFVSGSNYITILSGKPDIGLTVNMMLKNY